MTTTIHLDLLDRVRIASPCPMKWEELEGNESTRHCGKCDLDVHNFSEMTRSEAEAILQNAEGQICAGFYRRADGTFIIRDCPVGLRAARIRMAKTLTRVAAALGFLFTGSVLLARANRDDGGTSRLRTYQPFSALCEWISPTPNPTFTGFCGGVIIFSDDPSYLTPPPDSCKPTIDLKSEGLLFPNGIDN